MFPLGKLYVGRNKYFQENDITLKKILMIENSTGLNLSNYKKNLNSYEVL